MNTYGGISCSKQASKVLVYRNRKGIYKIKEMRLRIILASVATAVMQELGHATTGGAGVALGHVVHEVFIGLMNNLKRNYTTVLQPQRPFMNSEIKLRKALPSQKYDNSKKFYCESKTNKGISNSEHPNFMPIYRTGCWL